MLLLENARRRRTAPKKSTGKAFRVRDFPFFFMHWIITKNNQNIGEAIRELGVTPHIWRILALLQERDGVSITELSDASLIDRTLLSRILSDLARRGFVRKQSNSKDMRYSTIYLTPSGKRKFEELLPIARRQIERAVAGLTASELARLNRTLSAIIRNLSRSPL